MPDFKGIYIEDADAVDLPGQRVATPRITKRRALHVTLYDANGVVVSTLTPDPIRLRNATSASAINPATEDTLEAARALIEILRAAVGPYNGAMPQNIVAVGGELNDGDQYPVYPLCLDANGNLCVNITDSEIITTQADAQANTKNGLIASAFAYLFNGSSWDRARGDIANGLDVDVTRSALPTGASTEATLAAIKTAAEILDNIVSGSEAQVDVLTQPARAATTDTITAKLATDAIQNGTTALTPKFAVIDCATSGDNTIISAVNPKKIRVLAGLLIAAGTVNVRFESGASGTALTGQMNLVANTGFQIPFCPLGNFETASNTLLNLELSAAISVDGWLVYCEV